METYRTQSNVTPEYQSRFSLIAPIHNIANRGKDKRMAEKILYWGADMWLWQHWVRKGLFYPMVFAFGFVFAVIIIL